VSHYTVIRLNLNNRTQKYYKLYSHTRQSEGREW
jgi:hypothetical protein